MNRTKSKAMAQLLIIICVLIAMFVFFTAMKPGFASWVNIMTIALSTCVNGLLAIAVTFVITTAGIDLSIGTTMTFSCVMSGIAFTRWGFPIGLAIAFSFVVGAVCGGVSGFAVAKMKLPPFIATLAMQMMTKGLSLVVSGIKPVYFTAEPGYQAIALGSFLGIDGFYNAFALFILGIAIAYILYSRTLFGRYTQAIGSNEEAARLSGINTDRWKILVYMVSGLFSAFAGLIMSSRLGSAQPQLGAGYESEAIAAAVIGGTSMSGGEGSIFGVVIGAFIISVLSNGLRSMAVSTEWQTVVTGTVLAGAVYFDLLRKRGRTD
ncbi:ABC transporter permease [Bacillota bacterium Meth-B3]|nr:ABC transporter permease [Christensenellaceae bacterium]